MATIDQIQQIRREMMVGNITRPEAFRLAEPLVQEMNDKAAAVAKQFGRRHKAWPVIKFLHS